MRCQNACDSEISFVQSGPLFDDARIFELRGEASIMARQPKGILSGGRSASVACQAELLLNSGNHVWLRAAQDMRLMSTRGIAWITFDGEAGETIIGPGEAFVILSGKTALIGPLRESVRLELGAAPDVRMSPSYAPYAV